MALPAASWTARRAPSLSAEVVVTTGLVVIVSALVLVPLVMVVFGAAREAGGFSLRPLLTVLGSTTIIGNTLMMGIGATLLSVAAGGTVLSMSAGGGAGGGGRKQAPQASASFVSSETSRAATPSAEAKSESDEWKRKRSMANLPSELRVTPPRH